MEIVKIFSWSWLQSWLFEEVVVGLNKSGAVGVAAKADSLWALTCDKDCAIFQTPQLRRQFHFITAGHQLRATTGVIDFQTTAERGDTLMAKRVHLLSMARFMATTEACHYIVVLESSAGECRSRLSNLTPEPGLGRHTQVGDAGLINRKSAPCSVVTSSSNQTGESEIQFAVRYPVVNVLVHSPSRGLQVYLPPFPRSNRNWATDVLQEEAANLCPLTWKNSKRKREDRGIELDLRLPNGEYMQ